MGYLQCPVWLAELCDVWYRPFVQPLLGRRHSRFLPDEAQREARPLAILPR